MQYFHFQLFFNSGASNSGTSSLTSKFGNGVFKKVYGKTVFGTMDGEVMKTLKDFDDIYQSIQTYSDITWRVKIKGSLESTSFFTKGDKVSVGNIVSI
jgi:hypothetical protein